MYEELATSTSAKSVVTPIATPYIPPNDNTAAVAEFRRMLAEEEMREVIGEQYTAETTSAAREAGMSRQDFEDLAKRVVFEGSQMHTETRKQSQDAAAAAVRLTQLQTGTLLREHIKSHEGIKDNVNMKQPVG